MATAHQTTASGKKKPVNLRPTYDIPKDFPHRSKAIGYCDRLTEYGLACKYNTRIGIVLSLPEEEEHRSLENKFRFSSYEKLKEAFNTARETRASGNSDTSDADGSQTYAMLEHALLVLGNAFQADRAASEKQPGKIQNSSISGAHVSPNSPLFNQPASETMTAKTRAATTSKAKPKAPVKTDTATATNKALATKAVAAAGKAVKAVGACATKSKRWQRLTSPDALAKHLFQQYGVHFDKSSEDIAKLFIIPNNYLEMSQYSMLHGLAYDVRIAQGILKDFTRKLVMENINPHADGAHRAILMDLLTIIDGVVENNKSQIEKIDALDHDGLVGALQGYGFTAQRIGAGLGNPDGNILVELQQPNAVNHEKVRSFIPYPSLQNLYSAFVGRYSSYMGLREVRSFLVHLASLPRVAKGQWFEILESAQISTDNRSRINVLAKAGYSFTDDDEVGDSIRLHSPVGCISNDQYNWIDLFIALREAKQLHSSDAPGSLAKLVLEKITARKSKKQLEEHRDAERKVVAMETTSSTARWILRGYGIDVTVGRSEDAYSMNDVEHFQHPGIHGTLIDAVPYKHSDVESAFVKARELSANYTNSNLRDVLLHFLSKVEKYVPPVHDNTLAATAALRAAADAKEESDKAAAQELATSKPVDNTFVSNGADAEDETNIALRAFGFKIDSAGDANLVRLINRADYEKVIEPVTGVSFVDAARANSLTAMAVTSETIKHQDFRSDLLRRLNNLAEINKGKKSMEQSKKDMELVREIKQGFADQVKPYTEDERVTDGTLRKLGIMILKHDNGDEYLELSPEAGGRARGALQALYDITGGCKDKPVDLRFKRALVRVASPDNLKDLALESFEHEGLRLKFEQTGLPKGDGDTAELKFEDNVDKPENKASNESLLSGVATMAEGISALENMVNQGIYPTYLRIAFLVTAEDMAELHKFMTRVSWPQDVVLSIEYAPGVLHNYDSLQSCVDYYDIAKLSGFKGTKEEWLESIKGKKMTRLEKVEAELEALKKDVAARTANFLSTSQDEWAQKFAAQHVDIANTNAENVRKSEGASKGNAPGTITSVFTIPKTPLDAFFEKWIHGFLLEQTSVAERNKIIANACSETLKMFLKDNGAAESVTDVMSEEVKTALGATLLYCNVADAIKPAIAEAATTAAGFAGVAKKAAEYFLNDPAIVSVNLNKEDKKPEATMEEIIQAAKQSEPGINPNALFFVAPGKAIMGHQLGQWFEQNKGAVVQPITFATGAGGDRENADAGKKEEADPGEVTVGFTMTGLDDFKLTTHRLLVPGDNQKRDAVHSSQLPDTHISLAAASKPDEHFSDAYIIRYFLHNLPEVHLLDPNNLPEDIKSAIKSIRAFIADELPRDVARRNLSLIEQGESLHLKNIANKGDDLLSPEDITLSGERNLLGARLKK